MTSYSRSNLEYYDVATDPRSNVRFTAVSLRHMDQGSGVLFDDRWRLSTYHGARLPGGLLGFNRSRYYAGGSLQLHLIRFALCKPSLILAQQG